LTWLAPLAGWALAASAQSARPPGVAPPGPNEVVIWAVTKTVEGHVYHLRGSVSLQTTEFQLWADEADYNEETGEAQARGHIHFQQFLRGEELWADRAEYNLRLDTGRFYNVHGTSPPKITHRPGLLTTTNPFYFEGRWVERLKEKYILHDGFVTDCRLPKPWWTLRAPTFDIIPQERAIAHRAIFRLRSIPLLYAPVYYKSLEEQPRQSGFLTPNIGNSSRRGKMVGVGYYWAINRSYDTTYRVQWLTQRGFAHQVDFRGKPTGNSDFNLILYGVNDRGLKTSGGELLKQGGVIISGTGRAGLGRGWEGRLSANYLSSMRFRSSFTESLDEAIFSEVHSVGYVGKHWSSYGFNIVAARLENIQNAGQFDSTIGAYLPDEKIVIRKLPEAEFNMRERRIRKWRLPVWVSLESTAGLVRRAQPLFHTRQLMDRVDFQPRVMTAFRWKGFSLTPSFSIRETHWGSRLEQGHVVGNDILRHSREFTLELTPPSLARTFEGHGWLGEKVKHVIEPRAVFRHAAGIQDFNQIIRFDDTELASNTTEAEFSLVNRLYVKRGNQVSEMLSWQVWWSRYFDPSFGGAVTALDPVTGLPRRNVVLSSVELTAFTFLDGPRHYSPVVSALRIAPVSALGLEWRTDYDPLWHRPVNSWLSADWHHSIYSIMLGHNLVRSVPQLSPSANQFSGRFTLGNDNRRGWNAAFDAVYDFRNGVMRYATSQVTYNTDCCGFSVQYRRLAFGTRNENQFRIAFSVANIGSFGTLKRQDRLF
jgi:LPS-assembly protein